MRKFHIPDLAHSSNLAHKNSRRSKLPPPSYAGGANDYVRPHYYQVPVEVPRHKPWYRRKGVFCAVLWIVSLLLVATVAAGVAALLTMRGPRNTNQGDVASTVTIGISPSTTSATGNTVLTVTVTKSRESATTGAMTDHAGAILSSTEIGVFTSSTAKWTPSATTSPGPTISKRSNLAAVDTTINDTDVDHHRLIVWQDIDNALIARSTARGRNSVYLISDQVSDVNGLRVDIPRAQKGTPLAAASDAAGDIHVFYVSEEHHTIIHLVLELGGEQRSWVYKGELANVSPRSSLSATLHQNGENTAGGVVVLVYTDLENKVCFKISPPTESADSSPSAIEWTTYKPDVFKTLDRDHWDSRAIAIASGVQVPANDAPSPQPGDYAGLHVVLEGWDAALVVECTIAGDNMSGCYHSEQYFSGTVSRLYIYESETKPLLTLK